MNFLHIKYTQNIILTGLLTISSDQSIVLMACFVKDDAGYARMQVT